MPNIALVTGAAGFMGSHLVDGLLRAGWEVRCVDDLSGGSLERLEKALENPKCRFLKSDIRDSHAMISVLNGVDTVFHLACLGVRHSLHSPFENHDVNATGTLNLLEAARARGVNRFLYVSTSEIYGKTKAFPISESSLPEPITVYGSSKLAGENYVRSYAECFGFETLILRVFNNYGPRSHYEGDRGEIIPRSIVRMLEGKSPLVFGDGKITRDFLYVSDTVEALTTVAEKNWGDRGQSKLFNVGNGVETSMYEIVTKLCELMGKDKSMISFQPARPADVPRLWVDARGFREWSGWAPKVSLETGLENTIKFFAEEFMRGRLDKKIPVNNWEKL